MVMVFTNGQMEVATKVIGTKIRFLVTVNISGMMVELIKVTG